MLEKYLDLGFEPATAFLLVAVTILTCVVIFLFRTTEKRRDLMETRISKERKTWHRETRRQLAETKRAVRESDKRHKECEIDREKLHVEIRMLQDRIGRFERCPGKQCPMRLP